MENNSENLSDFKKIISDIVNEQKDPYLHDVYDLIINGRIILN